MARYRFHFFVWLSVFLIETVWVGGGPAFAGVRKASDKIADSTTIRVIEAIPEAGVDLPVVLPRPQDVYLLVTAGAAYTDVRVLSLPTVDPPRLAHVLETAAVGTSLAGTDVIWSADSYSAARLAQKRGRLGLRAAVNAVPVAALADGLRRAGFVPHLLLRLPVYAAVTGLPPALYRTRHFRWYDAHSLGGHTTVTIRARLASSPWSLWPLALILSVPLLGTIGVFLGTWLGRDERRPLEVRRRLFHTCARTVPFLGVLLLVPVMVFCLRTSALDEMGDLWLGSGNALPLFLPLCVLMAAAIAVLMVTAVRREVRLFGKPPAASWLSEEEKALNQRMTRWTMLPHILGAVAVGGSLFLVPHGSPLYGVLHPLSQFVMLFGAALVSRLFRKQVAALTKRTQDDDLTFRARRFGQLLGVRPREVWVEDSGRASHFAVAHLDRGDHIVVSRKMRDDFTPAEMDFVLAVQVARMAHGRKSGVLRYWMLLLLLLSVALPMAGTFFPGSFVSTLWLLPWFLRTLSAIMVLSFIVMLVVWRASERDTLRREQEADRRALGVTGDLAAARSALSKTDAEALPPVTGALMSSSATATQGAGRLEVRRQALQRTGEASFR